MKYTVCVADNFHYMDESERYTHGHIEMAEEALRIARGIVDEILKSLCKPDMTASELYLYYQNFGDDPFIMSDDKNCSFSAWTHAKARCDEICS